MSHSDKIGLFSSAFEEGTKLEIPSGIIPPLTSLVIFVKWILLTPTDHQNSSKHCSRKGQNICSTKNLQYKAISYGVLRDEIPILDQSIQLQGYCVSSVTNKTPLSFLHSHIRFSVNWVNFVVMFLPVVLTEAGAYPQLPTQPNFFLLFSN